VRPRLVRRRAPHAPACGTPRARSCIVPVEQRGVVVFSVVYVILPVAEMPPAEAIRASLAPFQRGTRRDLPDDWLAFQDETEDVSRLHEADLVVTEQSSGGVRIEGGDGWHLDIDAVRAEMRLLGVRRWAVRFADLDPDVGRFFDRFVRGLERHPATSRGIARFGRWLNPLGRWDWWDLGGRFDGRMLGERRRQGRTASAVSSGPTAGRAILGNLHEALDRALGAEPQPALEVRTDDNVELVSRLLEDAQAGLDHAFPGAVLLPPGSLGDRLRWIDSWPRVGPAEALAWLGLSEETPWNAVVAAAYGRFPDHWAACVAYHH